MLKHILYSTVTLIALLSPLGELAIFLSIMEGKSEGEIRRAAFKVAARSYVVLTVTLFAGAGILDVFGVSLPAFKAAGGLVLVVIGLRMLQGEVSPVLLDPRLKAEPEDHLWVPLVMPLIAGPAAMITVISLAVRESSEISPLPIGTLVALTAATLTVYLILLFAARLHRAVRPRLARLFERFFGLVLIAVGFQLGLTGIREFFLGA